MEILCTKEDLLNTKEAVVKLEAIIEKRFNQQTIWIVATGISLAGLLIALVKFHV